uniref:Sidekick cell adhesion molecule 1 n=1 Tax=Pipistrellus kuhlii TaxID=59472 RepID=A0A7J7XCE0_PIPKU|nr:sidekick cell adhesion molecule 1 [Pipistrellus kuhlii]
MARGARRAAGGAAGPGRPRGSPPGGGRRRRPRGARAAAGGPGADAGERGGRPATKLSAGRRRGWWALLALQLHWLRALAQEDVVPYFKTEPGLPQTHLEGNRLVLTCLAEGSWPLEFKWLRNDSEVAAYSSEYRYVIPALRPQDAGSYRCVVRNRRGALLQRPSEVHVAYLGDFPAAEQRKTVPEGQAAVLDLPPLQSYPRPQVTWFRDGHKIVPSDRIAITLENQLVILAATASDAGAYYVQAVNERSGENRTSPPVHLSVARDGAAPDATAPAIVVAPGNRSVPAGASEATLECVANARPLEQLRVRWSRNGVALSDGLRSFGRRLAISTPTSADTGEYVCEAALAGSTAEPARAKAFLFITEPPYLTAEPASRIVVPVEETVDMACEAMGAPLPRLRWYKDAVPLAQLRDPRYRLLPGGLRIERLRPRDSGIFQCFASNEGGEVQTATYLDVTNVAPAFTQLPADTTVTDGMTATLRCEVSGAPRPAITWRRGGHVLASGSVRIPRFLLLESGGLQISPVSIQDAGTYTCYAANSEGALNASATLTVWNRTSIVAPPEDRVVIKGTTATLRCGATHDPRVALRYVWRKDNVVLAPPSSSRVLVEQDGSLLISQTWSGDIGDYTCEVTSEGGSDARTARLEVIELPHPPQNLLARLDAVHSRTVLLSWVRPFDGNSAVLRYVVELSENNSPWKVHLADVGPQRTGVAVGGLTPARTYQFRVCAVNQVGKGQYSAETSRLMLPEEPPSAPPKNIVASGRTNQSIMVQWQPPPETEHNGVLRGYILRYRLAGLPGEHQQRNISSPEVNYCLVTELIVWTQYEIQVAAYNGAGLGVFSRAVAEYTLQGVPTAPPQNVQAEAVNSTTIRFLWNPPPQQFINGINQGYKLLAWPADAPDAVTVVTIAPGFHGAHHGYIGRLRKFTAYFTAALCFTTPGDGPPSAPRLVRTHEDRPGAVGHLSFTEILDTSLKVSWQEPLDKNGVITGYRISWEVYGRNESRLTDTLNSTTHEYKIQGLSSLTTYTIDVAALTAAGAGLPTSSTISSGVPPELPGAPSNLVISNISPRSATLQFRPGYDGKTAISRWLVEGQVGAIGDEEEWVSLYVEENEPDAQTLEIPNLTPYTHYRFRMRQENVVGLSPVSQSSRVIQTLQAPPDVAPSSVSVRTASETSLRLRWVPLPDSQYNGNPESVGYRVKYWRPDLRAPARAHVVSDRLERELTLEELEEWTEYEVQVQAFNAIGAGPWSEVVRGRTRESVPSAAPGNVSAVAVSSTQILLTWASVPEQDQNGLILGYKILFRAKDLDAEPSSHVVRGNHTQSALLAGLRKFVLYELQVLAFTRIGNGAASTPPVLERTKDDAPGPPVRLVFPEVRLTSVRIVWQPPEEPNGIILGYQIAYRLARSSPHTFTTVEVGATVRQFTATELAPESAYTFRLSAKTRQGWGEPLEATVITTEKRERPAPPRQLRVPQAEVTARSLQLQWVPGSDGASPIRYFTAQVRELPGGRWQTYSSSISHEATACAVDRLRPFTSYKLRLKATNDIGDSDFSAETEAVTTLQDVPGEPPSSVSVTPHTTSSVLVQWQPPSDESLNGLLQGYRIYYRALEPEGAAGPEAAALRTPSASRSELTAPSSFQTEQQLHADHVRADTAAEVPALRGDPDGLQRGGRGPGHRAPGGLRRRGRTRHGPAEHPGEPAHGQPAGGHVGAAAAREPERERAGLQDLLLGGGRPERLGEGEGALPAGDGGAAEEPHQPLPLPGQHRRLQRRGRRAPERAAAGPHPPGGAQQPQLPGLLGGRLHVAERVLGRAGGRQRHPAGLPRRLRAPGARARGEQGGDGGRPGQRAALAEGAGPHPGRDLLLPRPGAHHRLRARAAGQRHGWAGGRLPGAAERRPGHQVHLRADPVVDGGPGRRGAHHGLRHRGQALRRRPVGHVREGPPAQRHVLPRRPGPAPARRDLRVPGGGREPRGLRGAQPPVRRRVSASRHPVLRGVVVPAGDGAVLPGHPAAGGPRPGAAQAEPGPPELRPREERVHHGGVGDPGQRGLRRPGAQQPPPQRQEHLLQEERDQVPAPAQPRRPALLGRGPGRQVQRGGAERERAPGRGGGGRIGLRGHGLGVGGHARPALLREPLPERPLLLQLLEAPGAGRAGGPAAVRGGGGRRGAAAHGGHHPERRVRARGPRRPDPAHRLLLLRVRPQGRVRSVQSPPGTEPACPAGRPAAGSAGRTCRGAVYFLFPGGGRPQQEGEEGPGRPCGLQPGPPPPPLRRLPGRSQGTRRPGAALPL